MTTSWGYYMQGSDQQIEAEELGSKLSIVIKCPIHYPAWGKPIFECECGVLFPLYVVKGQRWDLIAQKHNEERKLIKHG